MSDAIIAGVIAGVLAGIICALLPNKHSRKYRALWIEECKRHANARAELTEWIKTAQVTAVDCAAHKTTIARLKREVTQLHERLSPETIVRDAPKVEFFDTMEEAKKARLIDGYGV